MMDAMLRPMLHHWAGSNRIGIRSRCRCSQCISMRCNRWTLRWSDRTRAFVGSSTMSEVSGLSAFGLHALFFDRGLRASEALALRLHRGRMSGRWRLASRCCWGLSRQFLDDFIACRREGWALLSALPFSRGGDSSSADSFPSASSWNHVIWEGELNCWYCLWGYGFTHRRQSHIHSELMSCLMILYDDEEGHRLVGTRTIAIAGRRRLEGF